MFLSNVNPFMLKTRTSYIFKTKISGEICYLIANRSDDMNIYFHSVTFSDKVLNDIQK